MTRRFQPALALCLLIALSLLVSPADVGAQDTRLLRQPTLSATHVAFEYGGDLWVVDRAGGEARRLTSTPAVEQNPRFSPDGQWIAFTSDRSGENSVYVLSVEGGSPTRLTWYPAASYALGWTPDGSRVLYASSRETAPTTYQRLWTVARDGGPSEMLPAPWGHDGSFSADGEEDQSSIGSLAGIRSGAITGEARTRRWSSSTSRIWVKPGCPTTRRSTFFRCG